MKILVLNSGSSSIKFQLIEMPEEKVIIKGSISEINNPGSGLIKFNDKKTKKDFNNHSEALEEILELLISHKIIQNKEDIGAIGHRVVHGGEYYSDSIIIDENVESTIEKLSNLAPLHNPPNLEGIRVCKKLFSHTKQVAVFDTAFHQTLPKESYLYPIPLELYEKHKIRKYGFHGTSHKFVSQRVAELENKPLEQLKIISCHLGNGASIAAIKNGKVIDTTMGFTPLEGLMMGTRSGDIDPAIPLYLIQKLNYTPKEVDNLLNKKSGLKGLTGTNDMREIITRATESQDDISKLSFEMYNKRIAKYIGAYWAELSGADMIIFTAGLGENNPENRSFLSNLGLGIKIDKKLNKEMRFGKEGLISTPNSKAKVYIIPTNEELVIARDTYNLTK